MTPNELATFLREWAPKYQAWFAEHPDDIRVDILNALDAAVGLLRKSEALVTETANVQLRGLECWCGMLSNSGHSRHCEEKREVLATIRLVLENSNG